MLSRTFGPEDQARFADLTGDVNPLHMDPVAASRTQAGAPVVHGMHALLWALDALQSQGKALENANAVRVQFTKFIYLDHHLTVAGPAPVGDERRFTISCGGVTLVSVRVKSGSRKQAAIEAAAASIATPDAPAELALEDTDAREGWLRPRSRDASYSAEFPHLASAWGARRVQALATLSPLVGMVCPGLHSVFGRLDIDLLAETGSVEGIGFRSALDQRFRLVDLQVSGSGIAGKVSAFARFPPIKACSMDNVVQLVEPREFQGMVALVVGGSRGLGAATAKIIAAGGGEVLITYANAPEEARSVADDIASFRGPGSCEVFRLDVLDADSLDLGRLSGQVTHLFYFATPPIFRQQYRVFSAEAFERFIKVYVVAFEALCTSLADRAPLSVFYPSSIAVEHRPRGMAEYSMAKSAGEILCAELAAGRNDLSIQVSRLPRILTDQTATLAPVQSEDAVAVMLPIVRSIAPVRS